MDTTIFLITVGVLFIILVLAMRLFAVQLMELKELLERIGTGTNKNIQEVKTRQSYSKDREKHIVMVVDRLLKKTDRLLGKKVKK